MLENLDCTIKSLCDRIQKDCESQVSNEGLAETTKALGALLIARASVATTVIQ